LDGVVASASRVAWRRRARHPSLLSCAAETWTLDT
jgi:hypothetical protein